MDRRSLTRCRNRDSTQPDLFVIWLLATMSLSCGGGEKGEGNPASVAESLVSSPGCPTATTVTSGLGNKQVPVLFLAPSGIGFGSQVSALVREFNSDASDIAFRYCLAGGCLCRYIPANESHVVYETGDIGGWTEVTILGTGGQPQQIPAGTVKRYGKIVPPSPNVVCVAPPPVPPRPTSSATTTTPAPTTPAPQPQPIEVECRQPAWSKPAASVLIEKQFPFTPSTTQQANNALQAYVDNVLSLDIDAIMTSWLAEIDRECQNLNPGGVCAGQFDAEPTFTTEAGDSGLGAQLFLFYRVKLSVELKGKCVPEGMNQPDLPDPASSRRVKAAEPTHA